MAIYKNREVSINGLTQPYTEEPLVSISYDGNTEQVKLSQLKYTKDEKEYLIKNYKGPFEDIEPIDDKDVQSVRLGNPPSYDREAQDMAEQRVLRERAQKALQEDNDRRKAEAEKKVDAKLKADQPKPATPNSQTVAKR